MADLKNLSVYVEQVKNLNEDVDIKDIRFAKNKDGELFHMINIKGKDLTEDQSVIKILKLEEKETGLKEVNIGSVIYWFSNKSLSTSYAVLHDINIHVKYYDLGYGSYAIKFFEEIVFDNGYKYIEGKYYPAPEDKEQVDKFYDRNGYDIDKNEHMTVTKTLEDKQINAIKQNIAIINGHEFYGSLKNFALEEDTEEITK